jgi:drug/metabolite transporter (DMT)-like permease
MKRTDRTGLSLAVLSAATFGTSGSFATSLIDAHWTPGAAVTARITSAAVLLSIPAIIQLRGRWSLLLSNAIPIILYGLIAVAGSQLCYFNAVQRLTVGVALMLEYLGTVLIVGWLWLRHGQRPRRLTIAGGLIAVAGLALVINLTGNTSLNPVGMLWGFGAAVGLAVYFVVSAQTDEDMPPLVMAWAGMVVGALALLAMGDIGLMPLHVGSSQVHFVGHQVSWLVPVVGVSVLATVIAYVAGIDAARVLGAKLSSFIGLTEVMFAVLFAWLLLGQLPAAIQLAGGVLIVAGVALVRIDELQPVGTDAEPIGKGDGADRATEPASQDKALAEVRPATAGRDNQVSAT